MIRRGPTLTEADLNRETLAGERAEYSAFEGDFCASARKRPVLPGRINYHLLNTPDGSRIGANYMIKRTKAAASVWSNFSPRRTLEVI
jgi:hypothetical protein